MGQKVNPIGLRLGINQEWRSNWFASSKEFGPLLLEDIKIRKFIKEKLNFAGVSKIGIERAANRVRITIYSSRPGIIIGRKGAEIDKLKEELIGMTKKEIFIDIEEVRKPDLDAQLVAENIALQLEKRVSYRRAMKKAVKACLDAGGEGIKVHTAGRLGGAEIARSEWYKEGKVPLHTLRAVIDYGFAIAFTTYGTIGVKTWIYKGEQTSLAKKADEGKQTAPEAAMKG